MDDWMINSNVIYNILHFVVKQTYFIPFKGSRGCACVFGLEIVK